VTLDVATLDAVTLDVVTLDVATLDVATLDVASSAASAPDRWQHGIGRARSAGHHQRGRRWNGTARG
jgi:hypothetical protein